MVIKKDKIRCILLLLIGIFCQLSPLMSRSMMMIYLGFCTLLFVVSINIKKIQISKGLIWFSLFVLYCMITLTYTINNINPDYVYIRILTYLYLVFLVAPFLSERENVKIVIKGFFIGGIIGILVVILKQYNLIGIKRLGNGIYGSYADFGNTCMLTMSCYWWIKDKMFTKKILKNIIFILILLAIIFSGARKAILVPIFMILFSQIFDKRKKLDKKIVYTIIFGISFLVIIYACLNNESLYKMIGYRIESGVSSVLGKDEQDASLNERALFKELAKSMFKEKPFFGWGMHSFAYKNKYSNHTLVYSHDNYLEMLSCYGILGFILYYWPFAYVFFNYKKYLYDDIGVFLFSYMIVILLMDPYSISFLMSSYILLICSAMDFSKNVKKK